MSERDPNLGLRIANYQLARLLGRGGMGSVYEAPHDSLPRKLAVKVLHDELAANQPILKRFMDEAMASSRIGNKHIVEVIDCGVFSGTSRHYVALEFLHGHPMDKEPMPCSIERTLELVLPALDGLAAAHACNIVHRDIKPENIFVSRTIDGGELVKLLDFGIAKIRYTQPSDFQATASHVVMGTPAYMAPEQCRGSNVTARADIYSMGCVLFELLCGRRPYLGGTLGEIIECHLVQPVPDPKLLRPDVPDRLRDVVRSALAHDPRHRPESARHMAEMLIDAVPGGEEIARRVGYASTGLAHWEALSQPGQMSTISAAAAETRDLRPPQQQRAAKKRPWVLAAASAVALALVGGAAIVARSGSGESTPAASPGADATSDLPFPDGGRAGVGALRAAPVDAGPESSVPDAGVDAAPRKITKKKPSSRRKKRKRRNPSGWQDVGPDGWGTLKQR